MNRVSIFQKMQKRKPKGRLEKSVQAGIISYLDTRTDIFYWRSNTGGAYLNGFFVKFGKRGAPDIHGLQAPHGRMFVVECKREIGGDLSDDQKRWRDNFIAHGGLYIGPARNVDTVKDGLGPPKAHVVKIPMRVRVIHR